MIESSNFSSNNAFRDITPQTGGAGGVIDSGLRGLATSQELLTRSAQAVTFSSSESQLSISDSDIEQALIDQIRSEQVFNASAEVVAVGDDNVGTLIDILA